MVKVHSYCSYKSSPLGFSYGTFVMTDFDGGDYHLADDGKHLVVRTAFESGIIHRLYGKIPNEERYIFLIRRIRHLYGDDHDDVGREVKMNFAFEFTSFDEFSAFAGGFLSAEKQNAKELYERLADCIIPDVSVDIFKLRISRKRFDAWFDGVKRTASGENTEDYRDQLLIISTSSQTDYTQEIGELFVFPDSLQRNGAEYWYLGKKNSPMIRRNQKDTLLNSRIKKFPGAFWLILMLFGIGLTAFLMISLLGNCEEMKKTANTISGNTTFLMSEHN